jgi:hypothetical protein
MSESKHPLLKLTELRYKNFFLMADALKDNDNLIAEILRVHLISEFLLEELIRLVFEEKAEAILSVGLRYQQKLELASKLELIKEFELLPDYVVGSLKKLNKLRNRVAHRLNEKVADDEIKDLFMGLENELPYVDVSEYGSTTAMKRYLAFIYGCMLPKYEKIEESPSE